MESQTIDRFASFNNTRCTRCNSRWWIQGTLAVDALSMFWGKVEDKQSVPPLRLIPQILKKSKKVNASCTLTVSKWRCSETEKLSKDIITDYESEKKVEEL